jgi:cysteinyl-tRNA synthetase
MRFHDTLAGEKVEFVPREPGRVSMYVCGPTVYDVPHLGHARSELVYDVLRRYLVWRGFDVTHVRNVTDVEDKIIARAADEGSSEPEVSRRYEAVYDEQMARLGVLGPDHVPHATEYVEEMQAMIAEIVDRGLAYVVEGSGVYFAADRFDTYGSLPHRSVDQLRESAGARVEVDERKRSPLDFALWKAAKPGEPAWDSPWGPGRPGWHIECSAMSLDLLGERFDLHGGGTDLVFPHHENERAQAEGAGHAFARYWVHHGMVVLPGGEKMSKSLGNYVTLADALEEYDPRALRMAVIQTHYRSDIEMGRPELEAAQEAVGRLDALARRAAGTVAAPSPEPLEAFRAAMDDDVNTPEATAVLFETLRRANAALDAGAADAGALVTAVLELAAAVGLEARGEEVADAEVGALVEQREEARAVRDFARADALRDELASLGWAVEDTPGGPKLRRTGA